MDPVILQIIPEQAVN